MYKQTLFLLVVWLYLATSKVYKLNDYQAYYWRDFKGKIPSDAFSAGKNNNNDDIYIIQVLHKTLLIPGTLSNDSITALYEYGTKAWETCNNLKIFCTNFPHLFDWFAVNGTNFEMDKNFVIGGYEPEKRVFIGRGIFEGELLVGKIIHDKGSIIYLHSTSNERSVRLNTYEVLTFTPLFVNDVTLRNIISTASPQISFGYPSDAYYWRDFKGSIPSDAFSAGIDNNGESVYIVQALYKELLIPGMLDKHKKRGVFEYGNQQLDSYNNFKILCSDNHENLYWQKTDSCKISISDHNIIGGYEPNHFVFIGRGTMVNELLVGKIITESDENSLPLMHSTLNGKSVRFKSYEILLYAKKPSTSTTPVILKSTTVTTTAVRPTFTRFKRSTTATTTTPHLLPSLTTTKQSSVKSEATAPKLLIFSKNFNFSDLNDAIPNVIEASALDKNSESCKCAPPRIYVININ